MEIVYLLKKKLAASHENEKYVVYIRHSLVVAYIICNNNRSTATNNSPSIDILRDDIDKFSLFSFRVVI